MMTREELEYQLDDYGMNYQAYHDGCSVSAESWIRSAADNMQKIEDALFVTYDRQSARIAELEAVLEAFVGHYPSMVNPYLDAAWNAARAALRREE